MICILAFILLLIFYPILGFFPEYRALYKKSWSCVFKKLTLRPCDMNFGEEIKSRLLSRFIFRFPSLTKFFSKTFSVWAFLLVTFTLWTLFASLAAGLNLFVYDTCNPETGASCSLSGNACGVNSYQPKGILDEWLIEPALQFGKTISLVPNRLKTWKAEEYLSTSRTFYAPFDPKKPTALEIIDPGCKFCKELFQKIKKTGFDERYNLSYLVYPIPNKGNPTGSQFRASKLIAEYLEAVKKVPLSKATVSADWQLLDEVFTDQEKFNEGYESSEIPKAIEVILQKIGYSKDQIIRLRSLTTSTEIQNNLEEQRKLVEEKIHTIRIPTIMFGKRRFDRVPSEKELE